MTYLAFDTSTSYTTVALSNSDDVILSTAENTDQYTQAKNLIPLIESVMKNGKRTFKDLDSIYVVSGPGSFTGIRLGLATALGFKIPSAGKEFSVNSISAFDTIKEAFDQETNKKYILTPLIIILDTKRGDFFIQSFSKASTINGVRVPFVQPKCVSQEELLSVLNSNKSWNIVGNALKHMEKGLLSRISEIKNTKIFSDFNHSTASRILKYRNLLELNGCFKFDLSPIYLRPAYVYEKNL